MHSRIITYLNENTQRMSWCGPIISFSVQNDYHYMTIFPLTVEFEIFLCNFSNFISTDIYGLWNCLFFLG
uniref:Uncharacterized protein n=1 Tax=Ascaris lumbricoides TaxID=6252 RepID=A0A0M3IX24_ASCLU